MVITCALHFESIHIVNVVDVMLHTVIYIASEGSGFSISEFAPVVRALEKGGKPSSESSSRRLNILQMSFFSQNMI